MIKKILVAVDGSGNAKKAVDLASDIAQKYGADLTFLQVRKHFGTANVPEELKRYAEIEHIEFSERDMLETMAAEILKEAKKQAREHGVEAAQLVSEVGDPAETILAYAKDHDSDVIVMGNRGLGAVKGLLLGSVSHKVAHLAECTCITVK